MVFPICMVKWSGVVRCILSICAFCYMSNLFGVMVFYRSIVNWSGRYMYPQYMCILLYVKLTLYNGIPYMYGQLEWGYMQPQYMFILLYVKFIWCNDIPQIYGQLGWSICLKYMCIVLYVKCIWCGGIPCIYGELEQGRYMYPQYMCILLYVKLIQCYSIPQIYCQLEWGVKCILSVC